MTEKTRLEALHQSNLLDTPAEGRFDRVTRITRAFFDVQTAVISLVDKERQWFKSAMGLVNLSETYGESFCRHVVEQGKLLVVEDATKDDCFRNNPLVTGGPEIRFYAGYPLNFEGERVATLCIWDSEPRDFSSRERQHLRDLAAWAESEIESVHLSEAQQDLLEECERLREVALVDSLTRTWTRAGILEVLERELSLASRQDDPVGCLMVDIDHFKKVNDTYGHDAGDEVLKKVADRLRLSVRPYDAIGRLGGEEFLIILPKSHNKTIERIGQRICNSVKAYPVLLNDGVTELQVTASIGGCASSIPELTDLKSVGEKLIKRADEALYESKTSGRDRVTVSSNSGVLSN